MNPTGPVPRSPDAGRRAASSPRVDSRSELRDVSAELAQAIDRLSAHATAEVRALTLARIRWLRAKRDAASRRHRAEMAAVLARAT